MEVRILTEDDNLFGIYDEDSYAYASADGVISDPESNEVTELKLHIHPEDVLPLAKILGKRRIDEMMGEVGISDREMRVWTANLALLNLTMVSALISNTKGKELDQYRDLAKAVLSQVEDGESIISLLGTKSIVKKAMAFGDAVRPIVAEVFGNPIVPKL